MLYQSSVDLYDRVINRIDQAERRLILKRRLTLQFSGFFITFPAFMVLGRKLFVDLAASGLTQFLFLLFSDFNIVMADLSDYVLGLLESAPVLSLLLMLTALLVLVFNLAKLTDSYSYFKKYERNI